MAVAKVKVKKKEKVEEKQEVKQQGAGEVASNPVETKMLGWIRSQIPDAQKCGSLVETAGYLANELRKLREAKPVEASEGTGDNAAVLKAIEDLKKMVQQVKDTQAFINNRVLNLTNRVGA